MSDDLYIRLDTLKDEEDGEGKKSVYLSWRCQEAVKSLERFLAEEQDKQLRERQITLFEVGLMQEVVSAVYYYINETLLTVFYTASLGGLSGSHGHTIRVRIQRPDLGCLLVYAGVDASNR